MDAHEMLEKVKSGEVSVSHKVILFNIKARSLTPDTPLYIPPPISPRPF